MGDANHTADVHDSAAHHSYRDYVTWPDEPRCEVIDGQVLSMSAAPHRHHQRLLMEIARQLANHVLEEPCQVYPAPFDVRLPEKDESPADSSTVVQPDISVVCDESKLDDAGCIGPPDLIVEIISPSTASKDQLLKRRLYERHGVKEFWIVHPTDQLVRVYHLGADGTYGADEVYDASMTVESRVVAGFSFAVADIFG